MANPYYVSVYLEGGAGNQFFQIAAMLGYAEQYGYIPVFLEKPRPYKDHSSSQFDMQTLFSSVGIAQKGPNIQWKLLQEGPQGAYTYTPFPKIEGNVCLKGFFQSELYFPKRGLQFTVCPSKFSALDLFTNDWSRTAFLHIRRGDYLHPLNKHHVIPVREYLIRSVEYLSKNYPQIDRYFVASDDIAWCKENLPLYFPSIRLHPEKWIWCPDSCSDQETMFWMQTCGAGICANSSFSWWAAYLLHQSNPSAPILMPNIWGSSPPLPPTRDLHPSWAIQISV